jgi:hypothetical protein
VLQINDILDCLGEKDVTTSDIRDEFHSLEQFAKECMEDTGSVVKRFEKWLARAQKIYDAYAVAGGMESSVPRIL